MSTATRVITADELLRMPDDGFRYELLALDGESVIPGFRCRVADLFAGLAA
jgi:hypothetical protein